VDSAKDLRRAYVARSVRPGYLERDECRDWEDKVRAELVMLRAALDSGEIEESGVDFHNRTLKAVDKLRIEVVEGRPLPKEDVLGCMYYITDVCQHRFVRADV